MPIDEDGNRADVISDLSSTVSRINIGRLYERYFNASSRRVKKIITDEVKELYKLTDVTKETLPKLKDKDVKWLFDRYILTFVKLLGNIQYKIYLKAYENNDVTKMREVILETLFKEFYIYFTVENEKRAYEVILDIECTIFRPTYNRVKYRENGVDYHPKGNVMIAPMYMFLLNKMGDVALTTSSSKINHFGLPIGVSKSDKHRLPYKNSPLRAVGETEGRLYASYTGRKFLAELVDRGASIETHEELYDVVLNADEPCNIEVGVDRNKVPYGKHKALEIMDTLFKSSGMEIEFIEDKRPFLDNVGGNNTSNAIDIDTAIITEDEDLKDAD